MTGHDAPTIDPFLTAFFADLHRRRPASEAARIDYLDRLLRRCLEEESGSLTCTECHSVLALERLVNGTNPFATAMSLANLVPAREYFVHSPWLRSDPAMQAAQWKLVEALLDALEDSPHMD
jgi:hypothetical protein